MQINSVQLSEILVSILHTSGIVSAQQFMEEGDTVNVNTELQQLIFQPFFTETESVPTEFRKSFTWAVCFVKGNGLVFKIQYLCLISQKK